MFLFFNLFFFNLFLIFFFSFFFFFYFSIFVFHHLSLLGFWSRNLSPYIAQKKKEEGGGERNGEEKEEGNVSFSKMAFLGACMAVTVSLLYLGDSDIINGVAEGMGP